MELKPWHYLSKLGQQMKDEWEKTKREHVNSESYEEGTGSHYDDWVKDEHYRRMKEDIERLLREENAEKK